MRLALALVLVVGCATGNRDWRRASYDTTVALRHAGDGRCSDPAPFVSFRVCLIHDAAYELARRARCTGHELALASEQARLAADLDLARGMAADGYPEWWVVVYFAAVRLGAWPTWHFAGCSQDAHKISGVVK